MKKRFHQTESASRAADAPVRSVKRALDLLDQVILADLAGTDAQLTSLARLMDLPANTVHNLLKTLAACGYVTHSARGRYAPGGKCRQLGRLNQLSDPVSQKALASQLGSFTAAHGEAVVLAVLVAGRRVVVGFEEGDHPVRVAQANVREAPFFRVPTGRMLAAMATDEELREIILRNGMPGTDWNGITDHTTLREELAALRRRGWCEVGASGDELRAWACPVLDDRGTCLAVAGTFVPSYRCTRQRGRTLLKALKELAARMGGEMAELLRHSRESRKEDR